MPIVKKNFEKTRIASVLLSVAICIMAFGYTVIAWSPAPADPPDCPAGYPGCDAPLNVGNAGQTKGGGLILNTAGWPNGLSVAAGNVGIGTLTPDSKLDVIGDAAVDGGAATISTGGYTDTVTISGDNFNNMVPGVSQLIFHFGGATPYDDVRTVTSLIGVPPVTQVRIDQKANWNGNFKYIIHPNGIKTTGALTTSGSVSFLSDYEGIGGIYIPNMDMLLGGGTDGIFKFRQEDIATKPSSMFIFGNHKENVGTPNTMVIDTRNARVGIGTLAPGSKLEVSDGGAAQNTTDRMLSVHGNATGPTMHTAAFYNNKANGVGSFGYGLTLGAKNDDSFGSIQSGQFDNSGALSGPGLNLILNPDFGNVGIGAPDPSQKLDVNGAIKMRPSAVPAAPSNGTMYYDSTSNKFQCYQNGTWTDCISGGAGGQWTLSGTDMYNSNSGSVGIGTLFPASAPKEKLTIGGGDVAHYEINSAVGTSGPDYDIYRAREGAGPGIPATVQNGDYIGGIRFKAYDGDEWPNSGGRASASIQAQIDGATGNNDVPGRLMFSTTLDGTDAPVERMTIKNNGNVGIGTMDPKSTLEVNGSLKISGTTEGAETPPNYAGLSMPSADVIVGGGVDSVFAFRHIDVAGKNNLMIFGNQSIGGSTDGPLAMTIDSEYRRIGAGSFTSGVRPNATLDVKMSSAVATEGLHIKRDAAMGFAYLNIEDQATNSIFKVHENGKVGIGTSSPTDRLQIESNLTGADDSSIMIKNTNNSGAKTRIRFSTDAGEFLIARTSADYPIWPGSGGDVVFNMSPAVAGPSSDKYRFITTDSGGVNGDRMLITADGDVSISTLGKGLIMRSPDGACHRLTVSNAGALSTVAAVCPED
ncbi:MAG: hypothetical protein WC788_02460 [Candidatus Paceibacterota bacterium]|jgi:hypothetical protein